MPEAFGWMYFRSHFFCTIYCHFRQTDKTIGIQQICHCCEHLLNVHLNFQIKKREIRFSSQRMSVNRVYMHRKNRYNTRIFFKLFVPRAYGSCQRQTESSITPWTYENLMKILSYFFCVFISLSVHFSMLFSSNNNRENIIIQFAMAANKCFHLSINKDRQIIWKTKQKSGKYKSGLKEGISTNVFFFFKDDFSKTNLRKYFF